MKMKNLTVSLAILGLFALAGCPKSGGGGGWSEEDLATNPAANFQKGLSILQNPDRRTGAVDYDTAFKSFNASANLGGGPKASFNAGWTAEKIGRPADAEHHYRVAYEADPTYDAAMFSLARILAQQGKSEDAVLLYQGHAEKEPDNLEARNDLVAALIKAQKFEEAIAESQAILRKDPKNASVYRNLSALYYEQGNYGMSQLTAKKALELNEGDPGVYNNMGVTYLLQGNESAAIEKFKTAIKLDSTNYESNMNLGFTALNSGDYTLALSSFQAAITTNPSSLDAKLGLAVSTRGIRDFKLAGQLYDEIIDANPQSEAAYYNAATLHEKYTKDFGKAQKYLQAYIDAHAGEISPTHEVFALMERVNQAKAEEDEKKRLEAERKQAEIDRQKRNEQLLKDMSLVITETQAKLARNLKCIDPGSVEEVGMILEQAAMVVEMEEIDMAGDIKQLLDMYVPAVDGAIEGCDPRLVAAQDAEMAATGKVTPLGEEGLTEPTPEQGTEGEEPPAEGEDAPTNGDDVPAEGGEEPAEGAEDPPADEGGE
jgi:tetratricopeptide (TPR) repeat protein